LVLLQARLQSDPSILTLFKDVLVLVLGQDSIVGLDVVLLEHRLIATVYQLMSLSCRVGCGGVYPRAVHHGRSVTVLCMVHVSRAIRTENVQERVLQAEELVAVGRHDGVMCWVVVRGLWYTVCNWEDGSR
jgi:hypothetical protein